MKFNYRAPNGFKLSHVLEMREDAEETYVVRYDLTEMYMDDRGKIHFDYLAHGDERLQIDAPTPKLFVDVSGNRFDFVELEAFYCSPDGLTEIRMTRIS